MFGALIEMKRMTLWSSLCGDRQERTSSKWEHTSSSSEGLSSERSSRSNRIFFFVCDENVAMFLSTCTTHNNSSQQLKPCTLDPQSSHRGDTKCTPPEQRASRCCNGRRRLSLLCHHDPSTDFYQADCQSINLPPTAADPLARGASRSIQEQRTVSHLCPLHLRQCSRELCEFIYQD